MALNLHWAWVKQQRFHCSFMRAHQVPIMKLFWRWEVQFRFLDVSFDNKISQLPVPLNHTLYHKCILFFMLVLSFNIILKHFHTSKSHHVMEQFALCVVIIHLTTLLLMHLRMCINAGYRSEKHWHKIKDLLSAIHLRSHTFLAVKT